MLAKRVGIPAMLLIVAVLLAVQVDRISLRVARAAPVGDVTLSTPLQVPVEIRSIAPGDRGSAGILRVRYLGNVPAWVGLDAELLGPLSEGTSPLAVNISYGRTELNSNSVNQVVGLFEPGSEVNLRVDYTFPIGAGNPYQGTSANLFLRLHAVRATENTRFERGIAQGPITWNAPPIELSASANELGGGPVSGSAVPCEGPDCAPQTSDPGPKPVAGTVPPGGVIFDMTSCCQCFSSLAWIGLLYVLLIIVGMLFAFLAGWYLRTRRITHRYRLDRRSSSALKQRE